MYSDKNLTCADCGQEFVFTASEQDFYAQRGFTEPRRCPSCRASRKAARNAEGGGSSYGSYGAGGGYSAGGSRRLAAAAAVAAAHRDRGPREMFTATCSQLRQGRPGPVPPDERQARLLQRLLPEHARRLIHILSARADQRPAEPASIPDPGRQPTRVERFPRAACIGSRARPLRYPGAVGPLDRGHRGGTSLGRTSGSLVALLHPCTIQRPTGRSAPGAWPYDLTLCVAMRSHRSPAAEGPSTRTAWWWRPPRLLAAPGPGGRPALTR